MQAKSHKIYTATSKYITDSIWYGKVNRVNSILALNVPSNVELRERMNALLIAQDHKFVSRLYNQYKDDPLVKWKDSIKNIIGLSPAEIPGLDI